MAVRYLIRRESPEDLGALHEALGDVAKQLGPAGMNLRRNIRVHYGPLSIAVFTFMTRKKENDWIWVCPSVELAAENEVGLRELGSKYNVGNLPHLGNEPATS